jgi:hypothetical protein
MAGDDQKWIPLSTVCGLTARDRKIFPFTMVRYRQLAKEGRLPPIVKGKIEFIPALKQAFDYFVERAEGRDTPSLTDEKTRQARVSAELKELQLAKERSELIQKADHIKIVTGKAAFLCHALDVYEDRLSAKCESKSRREIAEIIKQENKILREALSGDADANPKPN